MNNAISACTWLLIGGLTSSPPLFAAETASTSEIDNGFTAQKVLTLPAPSVGAGRIVDQAVIDSGYGGLDGGFPDLFRVFQTGEQAIAIEVVKTDPDALDYGVVAGSPSIDLGGEAAAIAVAPASGLGFAESLPAVWVGFNAEQANEASGVALIDPSNFNMVRTYGTGAATVRAVLVIDTPLNGTPTPASDAAFPDVFVATQSDQGNEIRVFNSETGEPIQTFAAPAGNITAMAVAPIESKSNAIGVDPTYPWLLVATEKEGVATLTLIHTETGQQNGGSMAAPPGVVTGISFADTPFSEFDPTRPDIFISYVNENGDNLIRVYNSFTNNAIGTEYPARQPKGDLVGLVIIDTGHDLGIGDPGHGAIFYAINPR